MRSRIITQIMMLADLAKDVPEAANLLRTAASDITAAARGPFSAKERKALGPIADVFDELGDKIIANVQKAVKDAMVGEGDSALDAVKGAVKKAHGEVGLEQAEPYAERWFMWLAEKLIDGPFLEDVENTLKERAKKRLLQEAKDAEQAAKAEQSTAEGAPADAPPPEKKEGSARTFTKKRVQGAATLRTLAKQAASQGLDEEANRLTALADQVAAGG